MTTEQLLIQLTKLKQESMDKKKNFEVEIRAKIKPKDLILPNNLLFSEYSETDQYFRYNKDVDKQWVVRIRKRDKDFFLTYKSNSVFGEGSWREVEIKIDKNESKKLSSFFLSNDFIKEVRIAKKRKCCKYKGYEINIDCVVGLGNFIEIEKMSNFKDVEVDKIKILNFLTKLGVKKEKVINKGYVALMREKNERNKS